MFCLFLIFLPEPVACPCPSRRLLRLCCSRARLLTRFSREELTYELELLGEAKSFLSFCSALFGATNELQLLVLRRESADACRHADDGFRTPNVLTVVAGRARQGPKIPVFKWTGLRGIGTSRRPNTGLPWFFRGERCLATEY